MAWFTTISGWNSTSRESDSMNNSSKRMIAVALVAILFAGARSVLAADVTLTEDEKNFTLANGTVTAVVAKGTGDLISLQYKGLETIYRTADRIVGANFTQNASLGTGVTTKVTIDPKTTNGDIAEVSVKGTKVVSQQNINSDMEF